MISDLLARINIDRSQPARAFLDNGHVTALAAWTINPALEHTAQAAAEWEAQNNTVADYGGEEPLGMYAVNGLAGAAGSTAGEEGALMSSPFHEDALLSAGANVVGIGVACSPSGQLFVSVNTGDTSSSSWQAGQAAADAEFSAPNEGYYKNGDTSPPLGNPGDPTAPFTDWLDPSHPTVDPGSVLPALPIAGGVPAPESSYARPGVEDGPNTYTTGVNWTCAGPAYPSSGAGFTSNAPRMAIASTPGGHGYWVADAAGQVSAFGSAGYYGSVSTTLAAPVTHMVSTPDGKGYWLVAADGGVFAFGDARFYGSMGGRPLNAPVVDLAPTPDGKGYWLAATDGGVFAFGDARFLGSMGGIHLNQPVNGISAAGSGYRLVAADGGIFSFGAPFYGSTGNMVLNKPVVGMADTPDAKGYWLVASDGGVFSFGDATFHGSTGGMVLAEPVTAVTADPATGGYWLLGSDGGIFSFDAPFYGADLFDPLP